MGVVLKNLAILKRARLRFITVTGKVSGAAIRLGHKRPLESGIKPGTSTAADVGSFYFINNFARFPLILA